MKENWRVITEFPNYSVSNLGRVKRQEGGAGAVAGRILKQYLSEYAQVIFYKGRTRCTQLVHRLVACQFVPNPNDLPLVNHIDGKKFNNLPSNLEWCTHLENEEHATRTGLKARGSRNRHAKLKEQDIPKIREAYSYGISSTTIAQEYGVSRQQVWEIAKGKKWKHI